MRKGALGLAGVGLSVTSLGSGFAKRQDDDLFVEEEAMEGLMNRLHFRPNGVFAIVSPAIDESPEGVGGPLENLFTDWNMRIIRYMRPGTQVVPLFPKEEADIEPYVSRVGFVVDDNFVEDDEVVFEGAPITELNEEQLGKIRPGIYALAPNFEPFEDSETHVKVRFSPIPDEREQAIFQKVKADFFGTDDPFRQPQQGNQTGTPTGNQTGNQTGNESGSLGW